MKTTLQYDHYFDYNELTAALSQFQQQYPQLMKLSSLTQTPENRNVWAVEITNSIQQGAEKKPAYYVDGNHHAGEVTGSMAALHLIDAVLTNRTDPTIDALLNQIVIYVIPRISPDGAETYLKTPYYLRSVNREYPVPAAEQAVRKQDLDGDGVIRKMRIQSKTGSWKESASDPRVMVKRSPDDQTGVFYEIYDEGILLGYEQEDIQPGKPQWGLDFNRNYPYGWFVESRQPGAGVYPLSNPETKAVADFVLAHPNICFAATMHTSGGIILFPPGTKPEKEGHPDDMAMFREIGKLATQEMGYPVVNIFDGFMPDQEFYSSGAFDDWCYHTQGIPAYTVELWDMQRRAGIEQVWPSKKTSEEYEADYAKELDWIEAHVGADAIKPWTRIEHPQLPDRVVEVGGFEYKYIQQNCPPAFLQQEVEKATKFCLRNAAALPRLEWEETSIQKLSEDLFEITAKLSNIGYLATYLCEEARSVQVAQPITISCVANQEVVHTSVQKITELAGYGKANSAYSYQGIATGNHEPHCKKIKCYVKGQAGDIVTLIAAHPKAGEVQLKVQL